MPYNSGEFIEKVRNNNIDSRFGFLFEPMNVGTALLIGGADLFTYLNNGATSGICIPLTVVSLGCLIAQFFSRYHKYSSKCYKEYMEGIRNLPEYKEAIYYYQTFIENLVKYLDQLGIREPLDVCLYCKYLMNNGFFSCLGHHRYKRYTFYAPTPGELMGGKVFNGTSVCRHMACFFADVLRETGAVVAPFAVKGYNELAFDKLNGKFDGKSDHLIIQVKDNGKIFGYDPTTGAYATFDSKDESLTDCFGRVIKTVGAPYYYVFADNQEKRNYISDKTVFEEFKDGDYAKYDYQSFLNRKNLVGGFFSENYDRNDEFFNSQYENICKIAEYQEKLCPQGLGKKFKW